MTGYPPIVKTKNPSQEESIEPARGLGMGGNRCGAGLLNTCNFQREHQFIG